VPETPEQALTLALYLRLTAPDDRKAPAAGIVADELSLGLDASTVELCKAVALERFEAEEQ
jgi:hypothetical protein